MGSKVTCRHFVTIFVQVRELIKRKLRITREIPFNRVSRVFHGPEFRGQKPVQVGLTTHAWT